MTKETRIYYTLIGKLKKGFGILENHETWFRDDIIKPPRAYETPNNLQGSPQIKRVGLALMISPAISFNGGVPLYLKAIINFKSTLSCGACSTEPRLKQHLGIL